MPDTHSVHLQDALQKGRRVHELVTIPGGGHGNVASLAANVPAAKGPATAGRPSVVSRQSSVVSCQSCRSATVGSTPIARRIGTTWAISATSSSTAATPANVAGSVALTV